MSKLQSELDFRIMALTFKFRDFLFPREKIIEEIGIKPGFHVLDYGCGPGSYILPLAKLVGEKGKIYALDIHPLAIEKVKKIILKRKLKNVELIKSDCKTGLPDESIDLVLLYDTYHDLREPDKVLKELHRILKPEGILAFRDHHMREKEIISQVSKNNLFKLLRKGKFNYIFVKT